MKKILVKTKGIGGKEHAENGGGGLEEKVFQKRNTPNFFLFGSSYFEAFF